MIYLCNVDVLHAKNNIILDVHDYVKYLIQLIGFFKHREFNNCRKVEKL